MDSISECGIDTLAMKLETKHNEFKSFPVVRLETLQLPNSNYCRVHTSELKFFKGKVKNIKCGPKSKLSQRSKRIKIAKSNEHSSVEKHQSSINASGVPTQHLKNNERISESVNQSKSTEYNHRDKYHHSFCDNSTNHFKSAEEKKNDPSRKCYALPLVDPKVIGLSSILKKDDSHARFKKATLKNKNLQYDFSNRKSPHKRKDHVSSTFQKKYKDVIKTSQVLTAVRKKFVTNKIHDHKNSEFHPRIKKQHYDNGLNAPRSNDNHRKVHSHKTEKNSKPNKSKYHPQKYISSHKSKMSNIFDVMKASVESSEDFKTVKTVRNVQTEVKDKENGLLAQQCPISLPGELQGNINVAGLKNVTDENGATNHNKTNNVGVTDFEYDSSTNESKDIYEHTKCPQLGQAVSLSKQDRDDSVKGHSKTLIDEICNIKTAPQVHVLHSDSQLNSIDKCTADVSDNVNNREEKHSHHLQYNTCTSSANIQGNTSNNDIFRPAVSTACEHLKKPVISSNSSAEFEFGLCDSTSDISSVSGCFPIDPIPSDGQISQVTSDRDHGTRDGNADLDTTHESALQTNDKAPQHVLLHIKNDSNHAVSTAAVSSYLKISNENTVKMAQSELCEPHKVNLDKLSKQDMEEVAKSDKDAQLITVARNDASECSDNDKDSFSVDCYSDKVPNDASNMTDHKVHMELITEKHSENETFLLCDDSDHQSKKIGHAECKQKQVEDRAFKTDNKNERKRRPSLVTVEYRFGVASQKRHSKNDFNESSDINESVDESCDEVDSSESLKVEKVVSLQKSAHVLINDHNEDSRELHEDRINVTTVIKPNELATDNVKNKTNTACDKKSEVEREVEAAVSCLLDLTKLNEDAIAKLNTKGPDRMTSEKTQNDSSISSENQTTFGNDDIVDFSSNKWDFSLSGYIDFETSPPLLLQESMQDDRKKCLIKTSSAEDHLEIPENEAVFGTPPVLSKECSPIKNDPLLCLDDSNIKSKSEPSSDIVLDLSEPSGSKLDTDKGSLQHVSVHQSYSKGNEAHNVNDFEHLNNKINSSIGVPFRENISGSKSREQNQEPKDAQLENISLTNKNIVHSSTLRGVSQISSSGIDARIAETDHFNCNIDVTSHSLVQDEPSSEINTEPFSSIFLLGKDSNKIIESGIVICAPKDNHTIINSPSEQNDKDDALCSSKCPDPTISRQPKENVEKVVTTISSDNNGGTEMLTSEICISSIKSTEREPIDEFEYANDQIAMQNAYAKMASSMQTPISYKTDRNSTIFEHKSCFPSTQSGESLITSEKSDIRRKQVSIDDNKVHADNNDHHSGMSLQGDSLEDTTQTQVETQKTDKEIELIEDKIKFTERENMRQTCQKLTSQDNSGIDDVYEYQMVITDDVHEKTILDDISHTDDKIDSSAGIILSSSDYGHDTNEVMAHFDKKSDIKQSISDNEILRKELKHSNQRFLSMKVSKSDVCENETDSSVISMKIIDVKSNKNIDRTPLDSLIDRQIDPLPLNHSSSETYPSVRRTNDSKKSRHPNRELEERLFGPISTSESDPESEVETMRKCVPPENVTCAKGKSDKTVPLCRNAAQKRKTDEKPKAGSSCPSDVQSLSSDLILQAHNDEHDLILAQFEDFVNAGSLVEDIGIPEFNAIDTQNEEVLHESEEENTTFCQKTISKEAAENAVSMVRTDLGEISNQPVKENHILTPNSGAASDLSDKNSESGILKAEKSPMPKRKKKEKQKITDERIHRSKFWVHNVNKKHKKAGKNCPIPRLIIRTDSIKYTNYDDESKRDFLTSDHEKDKGKHREITESKQTVSAVNDDTNRNQKVGNMEVNKSKSIDVGVTPIRKKGRPFKKRRSRFRVQKPYCVPETSAVKKKPKNSLPLEKKKNILTDKVFQTRAKTRALPEKEREKVLLKIESDKSIETIVKRNIANKKGLRSTDTGDNKKGQSPLEPSQYDYMKTLELKPAGAEEQADKQTDSDTMNQSLKSVKKKAKSKLLVMPDAYSNLADSSDEEDIQYEEGAEKDVVSRFLAEVESKGDELPTILPPKRRRRLTAVFENMDSSERITQEFPKHNWLENKISLLDESKKNKRPLEGSKKDRKEKRVRHDQPNPSDSTDNITTSCTLDSVHDDDKDTITENLRTEEDGIEEEIVTSSAADESVSKDPSAWSAEQTEKPNLGNDTDHELKENESQTVPRPETEGYDDPNDQKLTNVTEACDTVDEDKSSSPSREKIELSDLPDDPSDLSGQSLKALENAFGGGGIQTPENDGSVSVLSLDVGKNEAVKQVASRPTGVVHPSSKTFTPVQMVQPQIHTSNGTNLSLPPLPQLIAQTKQTVTDISCAVPVNLSVPKVQNEVQRPRALKMVGQDSSQMTPINEAMPLVATATQAAGESTAREVDSVVVASTVDSQNDKQSELKATIKSPSITIGVQTTFPGSTPAESSTLPSSEGVIDLTVPAPVNLSQPSQVDLTHSQNVPMLNVQQQDNNSYSGERVGDTGHQNLKRPSPTETNDNSNGRPAKSVRCESSQSSSSDKTPTQTSTLEPSILVKSMQRRVDLAAIDKEYQKSKAALLYLESLFKEKEREKNIILRKKQEMEERVKNIENLRKKAYSRHATHLMENSPQNTADHVHDKSNQHVVPSGQQSQQNLQAASAPGVTPYRSDQMGSVFGNESRSHSNAQSTRPVQGSPPTSQQLPPPLIQRGPPPLLSKNTLRPEDRSSAKSQHQNVPRHTSPNSLPTTPTSHYGHQGQIHPNHTLPRQSPKPVANPPPAHHNHDFGTHRELVSNSRNLPQAKLTTVWDRPVLDFPPPENVSSIQKSNPPPAHNSQPRNFYLSGESYTSTYKNASPRSDTSSQRNPQQSSPFKQNQQTSSQFPYDKNRGGTNVIPNAALGSQSIQHRPSSRSSSHFVDNTHSSSGNSHHSRQHHHFQSTSSSLSSPAHHIKQSTNPVSSGYYSQPTHSVPQRSTSLSQIGQTVSEFDYLPRNGPPAITALASTSSSQRYNNPQNMPPSMSNVQNQQSNVSDGFQRIPATLETSNKQYLGIQGLAQKSVFHKPVAFPSSGLVERLIQGNHGNLTNNAGDTAEMTRHAGPSLQQQHGSREQFVNVPNSVNQFIDLTAEENQPVPVERVGDREQLIQQQLQYAVAHRQQTSDKQRHVQLRTEMFQRDKNSKQQNPYIQMNNMAANNNIPPNRNSNSNTNQGYIQSATKDMYASFKVTPQSSQQYLKRNAATGSHFLENRQQVQIADNGSAPNRPIRPQSMTLTHHRLSESQSSPPETNRVQQNFQPRQVYPQLQSILPKPIQQSIIQQNTVPQTNAFPVNSSNGFQSNVKQLMYATLRPTSAQGVIHCPQPLQTVVTRIPIASGPRMPQVPEQMLQAQMAQIVQPVRQLAPQPLNLPQNTNLVTLMPNQTSSAGCAAAGSADSGPAASTVLDICSQCNVCSHPASFLCSKCKKAWYCSSECQMKAWDVHSKDCT